MELARDGITRWIPKDIPNIDRRIEPLLRLEILFPELCQRLPSGLFGEHNLEFSRKLSNTLLITLSAIDDAHIQKPTEQNQVVMDALADNGVHHPLVWKKLLDRYADKEKLFHDTGDIFTIKMCLNLVTSIYLRKDSPQELCSCTFADASVTYCKPDILKGLLSFFEAFDLQKDTVDPERRLSLAIVRALAPDSAPSTFNSHQHYPFHRDSTISKYQLLRVALHAIQKVLHHHPVNPPSKQWRTDVFWAIVSYMMSDIFTGRSLSNSEDSEFMNLFWTCRAHALVCMASLMHGDPKDSAIEPNAEWATKPLFLNILRVIHDEPVGDAPNLSAIRVFPNLPQWFDSLSGVVGFLLGQACSQGIPEAYEAFQEKGSLNYIADKSSLHPEFIEGLHGYITGLSDAKSGKFPDIQSDEFPDWHIQDLHQALVIRCIYHEYSVQCYTLHPTDNGTPDDVEHWKKDMKGIVSILTECLEEEKGHNNAINQPSTSSNNLTGVPEIHYESGWRPNTDIELGLLRLGNVKAT
ncbi:hypothetical protein ARMSODRAFT_1025174 [Armillaria solidipes]|uniref:Uncharacterized protein n=1 Tax=Armillaria solidipes TaxID=1076256 RepID=A0A2H3BG74_9AGAR|nr:hypothetical protein ARMSODRAFT_1025174 [Armillaria solidipes]